MDVCVLYFLKQRVCGNLCDGVRRHTGGGINSRRGCATRNAAKTESAVACTARNLARSREAVGMRDVHV